MLALEDEDRVVDDPVTTMEQPETVEVEVWQTSVVVVSVPLVTGDGEQVTYSAWEVEPCVQDSELLDDDALDVLDVLEELDELEELSSFSYAFSRSQLVNFLRSSKCTLIFGMMSSVMSPKRPVTLSKVWMMQLKRSKMLWTHP